MLSGEDIGPMEDSLPKAGGAARDQRPPRCPAEAPPPPRTLSPDKLLGGAVTLHQPARGEGYRVNVDAILLAWFAGRADARSGRSTWGRA